MRILKFLVIILGLLSVVSISTNSYFTSQQKVLGNNFSVGTWELPQNVVICHAKGNDDFVQILVEVSGVLKGHLGESHQEGKDIIPPIDYVNPALHFDGQNWDESGQAIYNNKCQLP